MMGVGQCLEVLKESGSEGLLVYFRAVDLV